ncbi:MAG: hypothetical protein LC791_09570 [Acidobacteria bacterium]|nr:hypothetical protein [Acidobacteriota bacterium]
MAIVNSDAYHASLEQRVLSGQLSPAMETLLRYYACGKPKEMVEHRGNIQTDTRIAFYLPKSGRETDE